MKIAAKSGLTLKLRPHSFQLISTGLRQPAMPIHSSRCAEKRDLVRVIQPERRDFIRGTLSVVIICRRMRCIKR